MAGEATLTPTQARYLADIRAAGERTYDGHARRPLETLASAGLIRLRYEGPRLTGRGKARLVAKIAKAGRV